MECLLYLLPQIVTRSPYGRIWLIVESGDMHDMVMAQAKPLLCGCPVHFVQVISDNLQLCDEIKRFQASAKPPWIVVMTLGKAVKRNIDWFPVLEADTVVFPNRASNPFYAKVGKHFLGAEAMPRPIVYELNGRDLFMRNEVFRKHFGKPDDIQEANFVIHPDPVQDDSSSSSSDMSATETDEVTDDDDGQDYPNTPPSFGDIDSSPPFELLDSSPFRINLSTFACISPQRPPHAISDDDLE